METKKMASIFAILMVSLSLTGFAYAHWYDFVYVDAEVNTGTVDADLSYYVWLPVIQTGRIFMEKFAR